MRILILGFSLSGKSAYELLKDNHNVYIYDKKKINLDNYYSYSRLKKELPYFDLVIRSPGIKQTSKIYQLAVSLSKKVISEIELGLSYIQENYIIGVTGSNGKTTLVNMLYYLLSKNNRVHKLGNIGVPLTSKINEIKKDDIVILELSSFQLENTYRNIFDIGIITNILDNHYDSVFSKECYIASKLKLVNLSKVIYLPNELLTYQKSQKNIIKVNNLIEYTNLNLNKYNQIYWNIACDIARKFNLNENDIEESKYFFKMDHYRMEKILTKGNLTFINDSKSTSISSTNACLDVYNDRPRILILGGIDKKENFSKIKKQDKDIIISYGKSKLKIFNSCGDMYFETLDEVIKYINKTYKKKYYVVFSPACASFDQYSSYIERGEKFNKLIIL